MAKTSARKDRAQQPQFFDLASTTAPCVPQIREAVAAWRKGGYRGATETTRALLNHWFETDHRLPNGRPFAYHHFQRSAVETLIYLWEVERVRSQKDLLERYARRTDLRLPRHDPFARYAVKMATGSGKTKVMALAVAWQYLNAVREDDPDYARTFLLIAPNVIVFERLKADFGGGRVFRVDPVVPRHMEIFWDLDCVMRGEGERAPAEGMLFLTNVQQLYEPRADRRADEPEEMLAVLGPRPRAQQAESAGFLERIAARDGALLVLNDEAHHTHDEDSEWNQVIRRLHEARPLAAQLDFSATPRFQNGSLFPWTVCDYPLKEAILDNVVKRPVKGVASIEEVASDVASTRYEGFLVAGVSRWREYREQLAPLGRKPILFVMMNDTKDADDVGDWLRRKYPSEFAGDGTLVIHVNKQKGGEITEKDMEQARRFAREVDDPAQPVNAIVSVLMLREGWDVQNVTVVVGLRPYTAKANILPEQAIGRGLRLMFRGDAHTYQERVDIIGNKAFMAFVEDLEKIEDYTFDESDGKDPLQILTITPLAEKIAYDIGLPQLTPALMRKRTLAEEIEAVDVGAFAFTPLPIKPGDKEARSFRYEGYDIITLEKHVEREFEIPEPRHSGEIVGYYAKLIAADLKLPSQFAHLAPKVREFFETKAFGHQVDLEDRAVLKAMGRSAAAFVVRREFQKALKDRMVEEATPELRAPEMLLSTRQPFPYSHTKTRTSLEAARCILNRVPCDNAFEATFARFLDGAPDVAAFSKLPQQFGFAIEYTDNASNMRLYYPDFVVRLDAGEHWLIETKGVEDVNVSHKDRAALLWCENATLLTGRTWRYLKVLQTEWQTLAPSDFSDLAVLEVHVPPAPAVSDDEILRLIRKGESGALEFKSSARWGVRENAQSRGAEKVIVKSVAALLNSYEGGTLLIGVADDGTVLGLEHDYRTFRDRKNRDGHEQFLTNLLFNAYGKDRGAFIRISYHDIGGRDVCRIGVQPAPTPVWVKVENGEQFYVRMNCTSQPLSPREAMEYARHRWR